MAQIVKKTKVGSLCEWTEMKGETLPVISNNLKKTHQKARNDPIMYPN